MPLRDLIIQALEAYYVTDYYWDNYSDRELFDLFMEQVDDVGTNLYWEWRDRKLEG